MTCRGVRGATTAESNDREAILEATRQLLALMVRHNSIDRHDLASAFFTVTRDLDAEFPALAARQIGWSDVPLLCGYEMAVPGSLGRCIRVLLHWNTHSKGGSSSSAVAAKRAPGLPSKTPLSPNTP